MFSDLDEYEKTSCTDSDESYSDQINSDVEAELYGLIHHEQNEEFSRTPDMKMLNAENNSNHKEHISTPKHSSFATEDSSFLKLFKSFETTSKSYFSTPQSHLSISTQNSFSERLDDSPAKCSSFNDMNKRKRDLLEADEEKKRKKSVVASKTSNNLTNSKNFVDSSESDDSIIVLEPSKDFTTNLSAHDTVELSSDDSSDSDFFSSRLNSVRSDVNSKRSTFSSSFKNGKTISDPWHVNNEDLFRTGKNSKSLNRYHNKMLQKCTNCNESGHAARSCTVPQQKKCFICGGPHMANYCENTICSKCYRKGHNSRRCWQVSGTQSCAICNMYGHVKMNCPDIWRRYHLTTSNFKFTKGHRLKQDVPLYCFNCGVKGHFGSECPRPRMQSFEGSYPTWPLVISYTDHEKVSRKERENSRGRRDKQCNSQQKQSRGKHDERSWNENINHKHQSILINDKVNERTPEANAKQKSKYKVKKILKLQSDQKLVKESNFPRSPRQNILTIDSERLKKTLHLPSSSMDDIPLLAQKKTLKNREKRRRRKSSLKFRALNKSN